MMDDKLDIGVVHTRKDYAPFCREELGELRCRAEHLCQFTPNPRWKDAYRNLVRALAVLDAHAAQAEIEHKLTTEQAAALLKPLMARVREDAKMADPDTLATILEGVAKVVFERTGGKDA